jgi:hypothetical protein
MHLAYDRQYSCLVRQKCAEVTSNDSTITEGDIEKYDEAGTAAQFSLETHFGDSRNDSYNIMH